MWKAIRVPVTLGAALSLVISLALAGTDIRVSQDANPSQIENEPSMTINRKFVGDLLNVVIAYNDIGNGLGVSWSPDSGKTWTDVQIPKVWTTHGDPSIGSDNNGNLYACFLSFGGTTFYGQSGIYVSKSTDGGRNWGTPVPVDNLVWPGSGPPVPFADKCQLAVDTFATSSYVNNIYVGWQRDNVNGKNSDIYFAYSNNGGASFSTPIKINDNALGTSFSEGAFPFVGADGDVYMAWYDSYFQGHHPGSLYVDKSTNGGVTFGMDTKVADFLAPPKFTHSNSCFRAKSFPSAAGDPNDPERLYITYIGDPDGYFDRRLDNGKAPGGPGGTASTMPVIRREGAYVYVVWQDYRNGAQDLYFNRSTDNGQTWELGDIGPLDNGDTPGANTSWLQRLSSSGSYVYCIWEDYRTSGMPRVYFNRSTNNGLTWSADRNLDGQPSVPSSTPAIASTGSYVYAAWSMPPMGGMNDIYFTRSTDNGANWGAPIRIDLGDGSGAAHSVNPRLACSGSYVYCMWADDRTTTREIFVNYSSNNGTTWLTNPIMLSSGTGNCTVPIRGGLEATGSFVYACWEDDGGTPGSPSIYFANSTNWGAAWNATMQISDAGSASQMPFMTYDATYVYVAWQDSRNSGMMGIDDIYFDYSSNNGATWQSPDVGPIDMGGIGIPASMVGLAAVGSYVYATWYDSRFWGMGAGDVFFSRSSNRGSTWSSETHINLGSRPIAPQGLYPVIAAGNGYVNIVWPDQRAFGIPNIYTSYSTDNGATWLSGPDEADVYCVRSTDGGANWGAPVTVNDDGTNYPQVLPWVVVKANGMVDLTYYDFRSTVVSPLFPGAQLRMAVSTDGAVSFLPTSPIQDTVVMPMTDWVGEYNAMAVLDDLVYTAFTDNMQTGSSDIYLDRTMNPAPALGACCFGDGSCTDTDQNDCENVQGGVWHAGTNCATYSCPLPQGACCFGDGSCMDTDQNDCENVQCCFADGSCMDTDQNDCENVQGGVWHGGTNCASYSCPTLPQGACCMADGSCMDTDQNDCENNQGGIWYSGQTCAVVTCPTTCCVGRVGDANGASGDEPTISDISVMIDAKFISGDPSVIACLAEADVNQSGGANPTPDDITISDISTLIDYLFITGPETAVLNDCL